MEISVFLGECIDLASFQLKPNVTSKGPGALTFPVQSFELCMKQSVGMSVGPDSGDWR